MPHEPDPFRLAQIIKEIPGKNNVQALAVWLELIQWKRLPLLLRQLPDEVFDVNLALKIRQEAKGRFARGAKVDHGRTRSCSEDIGNEWQRKRRVLLLPKLELLGPEYLRIPLRKVYSRHMDALLGKEGSVRFLRRVALGA